MTPFQAGGQFIAPSAGTEFAQEGHCPVSSPGSPPKGKRRLFAGPPSESNLNPVPRPEHFMHPERITLQLQPEPENT